eukprot:356375-Chlamydomonas_euryale.AAC.6
MHENAWTTNAYLHWTPVQLIRGFRTLSRLQIQKHVPGKLDSRLAALHTSVHWKDLVVAKQLGDVLLIFTEHVCGETGQQIQVPYMGCLLPAACSQFAAWHRGSGTQNRLSNVGPLVLGILPLKKARDVSASTLAWSLSALTICKASRT